MQVQGEPTAWALLCSSRMQAGNTLVAEAGGLRRYFQPLVISPLKQGLLFHSVTEHVTIHGLLECNK